MVIKQVIQPSILHYQEGRIIVYSPSDSEFESSFWLFLLSELCAMPQKPWAAKHTVYVLARLLALVPVHLFFFTA
jgi:hypothetical protein